MEELTMSHCSWGQCDPGTAGDILGDTLLWADLGIWVVSNCSFLPPPQGAPAESSGPALGWRLIRYLCIPELISRESLMESLAQAQPPTGAFGVADFTEWIIEWVPKQNSFLEKQHPLFMASNHGTETIKVEQCDSGDPLQQLGHKVTHRKYAEFVSNLTGSVQALQNFSLRKYKQCESFLYTGQIK